MGHDMKIPVLPLNSAAIHLETYSLRLHDMKWLDVCPHFEPTFLLSQKIRKIIKFG
jgi:hypothetical protein